MKGFTGPYVPVSVEIRTLQLVTCALFTDSKPYLVSVSSKPKPGWDRWIIATFLNNFTFA